jgi:hypothetical protein
MALFWWILRTRQVLLKIFYSFRYKAGYILPKLSFMSVATVGHVFRASGCGEWRMVNLITIQCAAYRFLVFSFIIMTQAECF